MVLRNFEGVITSYPEPENYVPGRAEGYFKEIYPDMEEKKSLAGIAGIMNDQHFNLVPEEVSRLNRRKHYAEDPTHTTLKNKREKRDELKEKKFQAQIFCYTLWKHYRGTGSNPDNFYMVNFP